MNKMIPLCTIIIIAACTALTQIVNAQEFNLQSNGPIFRHDIKNYAPPTKQQKKIFAIIEKFDTQYQYEKKLRYEQDQHIKTLIDHKLDFGRATDFD